MPVFIEPELVENPEESKSGGPGGPRPPGFQPGGHGGGGGGDDDEFARRGPQRGPSAGMFGMLLLMFSVTALFATVVIAYLLRSRSKAHWETVALPSYLWVSTGLIVASSAALEKARATFRKLRAALYGRWLAAAFFLGLGFIACQALSLRQLVNQGVYLRSNPHSSFFYLITGLHGVHALGGMLGLFYLIYRASLRTDNVRADLESQQNVFTVTAVYWHFLAFLWVGLFLLLLLWK